MSKALDNLQRLEYQLNSDHHPSNTVVVSKDLLRKVIARAKELEKDV